MNIKFFKHIHIKTQEELAIPPMRTIQPSTFIEELLQQEDQAMKKGKSNFLLNEVTNRLKEGYLENQEKQLQVDQLITQLTLTFGPENVDTRKLKEALLLFYLVKVFKGSFSAALLGGGASNDQLTLELQDFLTYRKAKQQLEGLKIKSLIIVPDGKNKRPTISNASGLLEKMLEQHFSILNQRYEEFLSTFTRFGFKEEQIEEEILKLFLFDIDYQLYDWVYADFFSFIAAESSSYEGRLLIMFDIFVITHDLTTGKDHPTFKRFNMEDLLTIKDYRNYRIGEVKKILKKKVK